MAFMADVYQMTDKLILRRTGENMKHTRLRQNITQQALAEDAGVSLSTVKNIEKGRIGSFDSLVRVSRVLGKLGVLMPLVEEEPLSPNEYYELVQKAGARQRKRAAGTTYKAKK